MTALSWNETAIAWDVQSFDWNGNELVFIEDPTARLFAIGVETVLAGRGLYSPTRTGAGRQTTYPAQGSPMTYTITGVTE